MQTKQTFEKGANSMPSSLHSTNWNKDVTKKAPKEKRATMMGEGLGSNLGIENPKHVSGKPVGYHEEQRRLQSIEAAENKAKTFPRRMFAKIIDARYKINHLPKKIENGDVLINQRVFFVDWPKDSWDVRAKNIGMPEGTDIAQTKFGRLLLVPVLEMEDALKVGIDPKEEKPLKDIEGRPCWVSTDVKERIEAIFGRVRWIRPLTIKEAEQFGVQL
jgi:hypothetical protein